MCRMDLQKLKKLLEERNFTQVELANVLGRDKSAATLLLQGKRQLKAEEARKIADWLRIPVQELLEETAPQGFAEAEGLIPFQQAPKMAARSAQVVQRGGKHYLRDGGAVSGKVYALEVRDDALNLSGMLQGDVAISELDKPFKPGDFVVFQRYEGKGAQTMIRRYEPPFLVPHSTNSAHQPIAADGQDVRIVSPVVKLVRLL